MPPSEMEDGLEVNIDEFFGEGSTSVPSFGDGDSFSWADDFISSATNAFAERQSGATTTTTNVLPSVIAQVSASQNHVLQDESNVSYQQVQPSSNMLGEQQSFVQQFPTMLNLQSQAQVQNTAGLLQGSAPQYIIKTSTAVPVVQQVQTQPTQVPQPRPSPAPSPYSVNSPLTRTVTPSASPAPAMSPLVSRSITPIQTHAVISTANTNRPPSHSSSPSPNMNVLQFNQNNNNIQSRPQIQLTNTMPIQGLIQNPSPNTSSIMAGQSNLTPNIVHTQNAVIQNPNVVNLNVAHVLCNNSQALGQQHPIQGTIIQTAQGKSILIPNTQLQGQQINLAGMQNISVAQPNTVGQPMVQNSQNLGNVIRLAPQQDNKQQTVTQPNYSFVNLGGGQGQQILIQRAPNPGQQQNIILRSVQPNIFLQQPGQQTPQHTSIQPQQIQQIVNQQTPQNLQFQQVFPGGQQMKIVTPGGGLVGSQSGAVTLNLAGQNINLQQMSNLGSNNLQGLQFTNGGQQFILQPQPQQQQQSTSNAIYSTASTIHTSTAPVATSQAVDPLTQALKLSGITENGSQFNDQSPTPTPPLPVEVVKKPAKSKPKKNDTTKPSHQVVLQPPVISSGLSQPNVQLPISQLMATAANAAGINSNIGTLGVSTVFSTAQSTIVTTTVSQSFVNTPTSVATSSMSGQMISSISQPTNFIQTSQLKGSNFGQQVVTVSPQSTNPLLQQTTNNDNQHLQRIEADIKRLMSMKSMTMDQKMQLQQLGMLKKKLIGNQNQILKSSTSQQPVLQMLGQTPIGQPSVASQLLQVSSVQQTAPISIVQTIQSTQATTCSSFQNQPISSVVQFPIVQPQVTVTKSSNLVQIQPAQTLAPRPITSTSNVLSSPPAGKVQIPAVAAVPTQIRLGNQILTLNLTPQQKEKLKMRLTNMTLEQQEQFLKQNSTLKLQQKQQQIQALQKQAAAQQAQQSSLPVLLTSTSSSIPITVQQQVAGTPVNEANPQGGRIVPPEIPKAIKIHQQVIFDQQHAVAPDTKTPFKHSTKACRRLLRYHVFQSAGPSQHEFERADYMMEQRSSELLQKSRLMLDKYRQLLLIDSMRESPSAEIVMTERMLDQDLRACMKDEKRLATDDPDSFQPMPLKYLKTKEHKSDESFEEDKYIKKESSFEEENSLKDTSDESDPNIIVPIDKPTTLFKNSPSSGTMKLLIRKQSQGFVSSLATEDLERLDSPSRVSVKKEPSDSGYEFHANTGSLFSSDACENVFLKTTDNVFPNSNTTFVKSRIKHENSDVKNPLHIHISSDMAPHHDPSYQHSDESYEDYKDSVLISRDMSNMSHTDVSDASMTEDLHAEFDSSFSPVIPSNSEQNESKSISDMTLDVSANLADGLCSDQSGRDRADIVDSVESGTYSSGSPPYQIGIGILGHNVLEEDMFLDSVNAYSSSSTIVQSNNSDLHSIMTTRTYNNSSDVLANTANMPAEFVSVDPNEITSSRPGPSYSVSYHRRISSAEVSEFDQSDREELNTSFSSDNLPEQSHALLSNQMQSAIDSILDNEEVSEDDYIPGQSNSCNSQDVSEEEDEEEEEEESKEYSSREEECAKGDNSDDDEDDLNAAVNSILM